MKVLPDLNAINKWVTDKRMLALMDIARTVLQTPVKGLTMDTDLQPGDADIIGLMLLARIKDEVGTKLIFTEATRKALQEAAKTWFLTYLKQEKSL